MTKKRLGRGLGAFYGEEVVEEVQSERKAEETARRERSQKETADSETTSVNIVSEKETAAAGTKKKTSASAAGKKETAAVPEVKNKNAGTRVEAKTEEADEKGKEIMVRISRVVPKEDQPRQNFDEDQLRELAESIREHGVIQPLIVQKKGGFYEIITGERRWRAAKMAGLKEIPVLVRDYTKQESAEIALIENVQREDLNPIEEAQAYQRLMNEFGLKQEEIAGRVSKNRTTITNSLRLLKLAPEVQEMVADGTITGGHARALLGMRSLAGQTAMAKKVAEKQLSVRETEAAVKRAEKGTKKSSGESKRAENEALELAYADLAERLTSIMSSKVNIRRKNGEKGKIEIEYASQEELERIVDLMESIRS